MYTLTIHDIFEVSLLSLTHNEKFIFFEVAVAESAQAVSQQMN